MNEDQFKVFQKREEKRANDKQATRLLMTKLIEKKAEQDRLTKIRLKQS